MDNIKSGNLGVLPIVVGLIFIVVFFGFKATNFFTATNFVNIIIQMAGTAMLAYGVVFVLLLGEIDLSISYVAGIGALTVAELQLPGSGHEINGLLAMLCAVAICAVIGVAQGAIVAFVGVPSFVVTLAGLHDLAGRDPARARATGLDHHPGPLDQLHRQLLLLRHGRAADRRDHHRHLRAHRARRRVAKRRAGSRSGTRASSSPSWSASPLRAFGTVAICNHATSGMPHGLPLAGVIVVVFLVAPDVPRQADDVRPSRLRRRRQRRGRPPRGHQHPADPRPRVHDLGLMAAAGGIILAANVNSVDLNFGGGTLLLNSIAAAVIGGVSLFGGRGEVRAAFLGALVIATVSNGLNTAGYATGIIYMVTGAILLFAVTLDTIARRLQVRSGR